MNITKNFNFVEGFAVRPNAFYTLTLIFIIYLLDYADRKVMSALFPFIQAEWGISDAQCGMLNGIVSLMIAVFVIPMSILVDRWSRKKMISLMVFVWSIATLLCAFADNYTQLLIFRALTGLGEAAYAPAAIALLSKIFPTKYRATYIGIYDAASPIGAGIGIMLGGYIGTVYGWQHAFGILAIPGLLFSFLFLFVNDYATIQTQVKTVRETIHSIVQTVISLCKIKVLWILYVAYGLCIGVSACILDWIPSFLHRVHGLNEKEAGLASGIIAVSVLIGAPSGGFFADRWSKRQKHAKMYVSAFSTLLSAVFLFCAVQSTTLTSTMIFLGLFGVCTVAFLAPVTSIIQEIVATNVRALAFGINVMIMNTMGAFAMPVLIGKISDRYDLQIALSLLPVVAVVAAVLFWRSRKMIR
ncbi:MAG: MFS transporter [Bacteroidetes bacterium]|nr:MFS transporter [Bacteroidota bacterium]